MADINQATRDKAAQNGQAMAGGRFPVRNGVDLDNAIRAVGRANGGEAGRAAVRRFIIKRATVLGLTNRIPDTWNRDGSLKTP